MTNTIPIATRDAEPDSLVAAASASGRERPASPREGRVLVGALLLLVVTGMGLRLWLYRQPVNSDDVNYMTLSTGFFESSHRVESLRFALLFVPRLAVMAFDYSLTAFYSAVYSHALVGAVGIGAFAALFSGLRAAVVVVALWATSISFMETDTRLLPDNLGIGLGLLALAALGAASGLRGVRWQTPPGRITTIVAACGGFLAWASYSTRSSFAPVILVGVLIFVAARPQRHALWCAVSGLAAGFVVEFLWTWAAVGEPFARAQQLVSRGTPALSDPVREGSVYGGYTWSRILDRYPDIVAGAGGMELVVFVGGALGAVLWLVRARRRPADLVKLATLVGVFGVVAFAVTSFDPPVPLMREKLRYYTAGAPLFYLGFADLLLTVGSAVSLVSGRLAARVRRPSFHHSWLGRGLPWVSGPAATLVVVVGILLIRMPIVVDDPDAVRRGHDNMLTIVSEIKEDARQRGWETIIHSDGRSNKVWDLLLTDQSWAVESLSRARPIESGYLVLNWHRLSANLRYGYNDADIAYEYDRTIEEHPLLLRHGSGPIDVFLATESPLRRTRQNLTPRVAEWTATASNGVRSSLDAADGKMHVLAGEWLYSGEGRLKQRADAGPVMGDRFIELVARVRAERTARLSVEFFWHDASGALHRQPMGDVFGQRGGSEIAAWTYLPDAAVDFRIAFRSRATMTVEVSDVSVLALGRHPLDEAEALAGAW